MTSYTYVCQPHVVTCIQIYFTNKHEFMNVGLFNCFQSDPNPVQLRERYNFKDSRKLMNLCMLFKDLII